MNNKLLIGGIIVIVGGLLIAGKFMANQRPSAGTALVHNISANSNNAKLAPDFTLQKLGGGTISLSEFIGKKPVVIDFWASWCPNCRRDMPNLNRFYEKYKDRKVVTFCTGGIRCEFATPQLVTAGFKSENLYQLEGGVIKYAQKYGDEGYFEGKCFVFDDRIAIAVDKTPNAKIVGQCAICGSANDIYRNCSRAECNKLFLACDNCWETLNHACSEYCAEVIKDPTKIRPERVKVVSHRNK